jgi:predicted dehydrogenase
VETVSRKLSLAMIGTGFIARAHSSAFHQVGRFFPVRSLIRTKVVCGRNQAKLEAFARQWGWEETAREWEAVVARPDIDIVDIAVPNVLHAPIALAAARSGKMVFCEKPLALSASEGRAMAAASRRPNLVWFNYRRAPAVVFAKQLIEEGRLGEIRHYRGYYFNQSGLDPSKAQGWRYRRAQAGSGASGDLLSHCLDTALYLNGEIQELTALEHAFIGGRDVDDAVLVMARFKSGALASFEASRFGLGRRNGMGFEIFGSEGSLGFDLEDMNRLRFFDGRDAVNRQGARSLLVTGPEQPYAENFWKPGHLVGYEHTFIATLGDFLMALEAEREFHPGFDDALKVQVLLETIASSSTSRQWLKVAS